MMEAKRSRGKRVKVKRSEGRLQVRRPNVAGIDLGSVEHYVACPPRDGVANVKVFGTSTPELTALADWLEAEGVESVAMESTGVYWVPLYELLDARGIEAVLVDARQIKHVPGRKTDMIDCQWLQLLHSCGLLRGAFRPADAFCQLRALVRQKATLIDERSDWLRRMQKSLDQMNVRVHRAVSDISGVTGMAMIRAIVDGERDPMAIAKLRNKRCSRSLRQMADELTGNWREDHLFNLQQALAIYDFISERIAIYEKKIERVLQGLACGTDLGPAPEPTCPNKKKLMRARGQEPLRQALYGTCKADLTTIDGISTATAETVLSELGTDLSAFPSEGHFVSFLKLAPKMAISGGKPIAKRPKGTASTRVGAALRMAALTLRHSKSALGAAYRRIARRKGAGVAVFAIARKLAILIYRMLRYGAAYVDEGAHAYEERFKQARLHMCHQIANQYGYKLLQTDEEPVPA
jgi:transposase